MRRLVWEFAGRTYHIVGNLMSRLLSGVRSCSLDGLKDIVKIGAISNENCTMPSENK